MKLGKLTTENTEHTEFIHIRINEGVDPVMLSGAKHLRGYPKDPSLALRVTALRYFSLMLICSVISACSVVKGLDWSVNHETGNITLARAG
jgi:hypothetical protein